MQVFAQLHRAERFAEVGTYTKLPEAQFFIIIARTAHDDYGDVSIHATALETGKQLKAVHVRHHSVRDNCVGQETLAKKAHRLKAIFCTGHIEMTGKEVANNLAQAVMVFHEKNLAIHGLDFLIGQQLPALPGSMGKPF